MSSCEPLHGRVSQQVCVHVCVQVPVQVCVQHMVEQPAKTGKFSSQLLRIPYHAPGCGQVRQRMRDREATAVSHSGRVTPAADGRYMGVWAWDPATSMAALVCAYRRCRLTGELCPGMCTVHTLTVQAHTATELATLIWRLSMWYDKCCRNVTPMESHGLESPRPVLFPHTPCLPPPACGR